MLLGLARGSGARSLAGMAVRGEGRRPAAAPAPAPTTVAYCAELGLRPWTDPQNADPAYARVRVRDRCCRSSRPSWARASRPRWPVPPTCCAPTPTCSTTWPPRPRPGCARDAGLDCGRLAALPAALRTRVLRTWLHARGAHDLGADHVAAVDALVTAWHGQGPAHLPGLRVTRTAGVLHALEAQTAE